MPRGLNRTGDFRNGDPVTLPINFGQPVTHPASEIASPGNVITTAPSPTNFGNTVNWTPDPAHFGNTIP